MSRGGGRLHFAPKTPLSLSVKKKIFNKKKNPRTEHKSSSRQLASFKIWVCRSHIIASLSHECPSRRAGPGLARYNGGRKSLPATYADGDQTQGWTGNTEQSREGAFGALWERYWRFLLCWTSFSYCFRCSEVTTVKEF